MRGWLIGLLLLGGCTESYAPPQSEEQVVDYLACVVILKTEDRPEGVTGTGLKQTASNFHHQHWTWTSGTYPSMRDQIFRKDCHTVPIQTQFLARAYVRHLRDGSLQPLPAD